MTVLVGILLGVIFGASAGAVLIRLWFGDHGSNDAPGGEPPPPLKPPPPLSPPPVQGGRMYGDSSRVHLDHVEWVVTRSCDPEPV